MSSHSLKIPEYLLEGIEALRSARRNVQATSTFDTMYAKGSMPLVVAQSHMSLKDHGLGVLEDDNGVLWQVEDGVIYRLAEEE